MNPEERDDSESGRGTPHSMGGESADLLTGDDGNDTDEEFNDDDESIEGVINMRGETNTKGVRYPSFKYDPDRYKGMPREELKEKIRDLFKDYEGDPGLGFAGANPDPEMPYPEVKPEHADIRYDLLDKQTKKQIAQYEIVANTLQDMAWTYGRDYLKKISLPDLDTMSTIAALYGIDRAMDSMGSRDHLWQGTPLKRMEVPTDLFATDGEEEEEQLDLIREYYRAFVQARAFVLFEIEKEKGYKTNIVGIVMKKLLKNRNQLTAEWRREGWEEPSEEDEKERQKFIQKYQEKVKLANEAKLREKEATTRKSRLSFHEATLADQSQARYKKAVPPKYPKQTPPRVDPQDDLINFEDQPVRKTILKKTGQGFKDVPKETRRETFYPSEGPPEERRWKQEKEEARRKEGGFFELPRPEGRRSQREDSTESEASFQPARRQGRRRLPSWEELEDQFQLKDLDSKTDSDSEDTVISFRGRTRSTSQESRSSSYNPLPHLGRVSGVQEFTRERARPAGTNTNKKLLKGMVDSMKESGMQPGYFTETNLLDAATRLKFQDELRRKKKEFDEPKYVVRSRDPRDQDLRIESFDFDIKGLTPTEILGPRFARTTFPDEASRVNTMRGILQFVVDQPNCVQPTKAIVLDLLGKFDIPKITAIQSAETFASSLLSPPTDDLIMPPLCGSKNGSISKLSKNIYDLIGMDTQNKYCLEEPQSKPLSLFLPILKRVVEQQGLNEDTAFSLLLSILKGICWEEVQDAYTNKKRTLSEVWISLQRTAGGPLHTHGLEKELKEILANPSSIQVALSKIQSIRTKMLAHVPLKNGREMKTSDAVYHDFLTLMRNHHPLIAVSVDISMKQREAAFMMENKVKSLQGIPEKDLKPFNKVQEYRELVCSYLATDIENACYPQFMTQQQQPSAGRKVQIFSLKPQGILKQTGNEIPAPGHEESITRSEYANKEPHERQSRPQRDGSRSDARSRTSSREGRNPRSAPTGESRIPRFAANRTGEMTCHLCKVSGHFANGCTLYPGDRIQDPICPTCFGHHSAVCRSHERDKIYQPLLPWLRPGYQGEPNRAPLNPRYPPQNQDRRYQPRFNAHPNYYGNNRLFNPHSRNEGRGDTRPREAWQGNGPERRREGGYAYDNRRDRSREDPYSRDQPRRDPREGQRQQEGTTYQRDQQPVEGALGNAGAQTPPTSAFISRIDNKRHGRKEGDYESDHHGSDPQGYATDNSRHSRDSRD